MPLKPGNKQAVLIIDDGEFEIYRSFAEARAYLYSNIDWIMAQYGELHNIAREDVIIVVGTLKARNYTMLVSNFSPRTTLSFNVHASPEPGKPWGTWTVNRDTAVESSKTKVPGAVTTSVAEPQPPILGGVAEHALKYTAKVSRVTSEPREAVMLAKLRIPLGGQEPALYP